MKECPICEKEVEKTKTELSLFNGKIKINPIVAFECSSCNEVFINEEESKRIDKITTMEPYRNQIEKTRAHYGMLFWKLKKSLKRYLNMVKWVMAGLNRELVYFVINGLELN